LPPEFKKVEGYYRLGANPSTFEESSPPWWQTRRTLHVGAVLAHRGTGTSTEVVQKASSTREISFLIVHLLSLGSPLGRNDRERDAVKQFYTIFNNGAKENL
jgi:hypothetical protein